MGGRTVSQWYSYSSISGRPETANYVKDNLPTRYLIASDKYVDYSYDSLNRLTGKTLSLATPLNYAYTYKASERGGNYTTSLVATETIGSDVYSYIYDKLGNITSISLNGEEIRSFVYDRYNQLKRDNNKIANLTYYYNYDGYGNLTDKRTYEYTTGDLGTRLSKTDYTYSGDTAAGWSKLLTGFGNETITYDAIGNPLTYRGATLDWDGRQLKSYDKGNTSVTYKYDADGLRASKTVNGETTTYQYVSGKLMYEDRNGTDIYYYYDSYGTPTAIRYYEEDGTSYRFFLATNQQGDVIGLYNASGNLVVKYEYDAWGNIIAETNATGGTPTTLAQKWSDINPFRYRGYYYDSETDLYYLQSRYYDAEIGRFLNADCYFSTGTGLLGYNMFAYCNNNPVNFVDLEGESSKSISIEDRVNVYTPNEGKKIAGKINVCINKDNKSNSSGYNYNNFFKGVDPNIKIINSYTITSEADMRKVLKVVMNSKYYDRKVFTRTEDSYVAEWYGHNVLYTYFHLLNMFCDNKFANLEKSAKDVDLNMNENTFFWNLFYNYIKNNKEN